MNKDVIYIDVEDDITAIIGKIKASKEKIVALVPPKRVGLLQSAVNLRLLDRMASTANKRLVLITNNQALVALSSAAGIPVAKNLQSKPEIAEISALEVDDGEDVIDGAQLPIGELEKTGDKPLKRGLGKAAVAESIDGDDSIDSIDIDNAVVPMAAATATLRRPTKGKSKVPNFDKFRKKLFIAIAAVIVIVGFLIWANFFAPAATIVITAKTSPESVSDAVTVGDSQTTNVASSTLQSVTKSVKKDSTVTFTPTGSQNVGDKATGQIDYSNTSLSSATVPAGTQLKSSSGLIFTTDAAVSVPAASFPCHNITCATPGTANGTVTAATAGASYNGATGSVSGAPDNVSASFDSATSGGTDKVVTVVSADDITKATAQLSSTTTSSSTANNSVKSQLQKEFSSNQMVIDDSFANTTATPVSSPALNAQATGSATLTATTTYTLSAVSKSDVQKFLDGSINSQISGTKDQRIYDDGISKVGFNNFTTGTDGNTMTIVSTGQVGPTIDETEVKKQAEGQIYGTVQSNLQAINGVNNVDIKFSYFWVTKVPNDPNKITIEFKIQNG